jgi:hypothetical protein
LKQRNSGQRIAKAQCEQALPWWTEADFGRMALLETRSLDRLTISPLLYMWLLAAHKLDILRLSLTNLMSTLFQMIFACLQRARHAGRSVKSTCAVRTFIEQMLQGESERILKSTLVSEVSIL